jgi:hypothetical protein
MFSPAEKKKKKPKTTFLCDCFYSGKLEPVCTVECIGKKQKIHYSSEIGFGSCVEDICRGH